MAAKFISSSPPHTHTRKGGPGGWIFAGRIFQERRVETRRASFSGIGDRISSRSYGRGIIERAGNESLVSLPPPSYLHKYRRVYAGCCSLALSLSLSLSPSPSRRSEFSASSRSHRSASALSLPLSLSLSSHSWLLSPRLLVFSLKHVRAPSLFLGLSLASGGNERVRIEASRRALSLVDETKRERTLSKRYSSPPSPPPSLSLSLARFLPSPRISSPFLLSSGGQRTGARRDRNHTHARCEPARL